MTTNTAIKQQRTAVIYGRVSSEEQVQGYSIQAQFRAGREWAETTGTKSNENFLKRVARRLDLEKREPSRRCCALWTSVYNIPLTHMPTNMRVSRRKDEESSRCLGNSMLDSVRCGGTGAGRMARRKLTVRNMEIHRG